MEGRRRRPRPGRAVARRGRSQRPGRPARPRRASGDPPRADSSGSRHRGRSDARSRPSAAGSRGQRSAPRASRGSRRPRSTSGSRPSARRVPFRGWASPSRPAFVATWIVPSSTRTGALAADRHADPAGCLVADPHRASGESVNPQQSSQFGASPAGCRVRRPEPAALVREIEGAVTGSARRAGRSPCPRPPP